MATLPARPNLSHLRRQARDVLRAAQSGDISAVDRIRAVSDRLTLAAAQLAVAREYGFTSWAGLKAEVEARTMDLAQQVEAFCTASIRDWTGRAARMLAARPEIADYSFATAVILGDDRGADIEARDTHWDSPPLDWAVVGSGERPVTNPRPDWVATVRLLIEAGASTQDITLSPDDPKPPSPEVAEFLRGYGIA